MSSRTYAIRVGGDSGGEDLRRLAQWLRDDEYVGEAGALSFEAGPPVEGAMGAAFELIQFCVDSGFQTANLILAVTLWRSTRSVPPTVTIERDGVRIEVHSADPDTVARLAARLENG
ncbi:hypothetical protein ACFXB3_01275 [Streptomyces sp. NPDC059447]|uniref:effector-associated constant component EACC1 n=1 Tax=Streptomyces sp. NPDC059447 TaxID=3346834 RepID=UPI0036B630D7